MLNQRIIRLVVPAILMATVTLSGCATRPQQTRDSAQENTEQKNNTAEADTVKMSDKQKAREELADILGLRVDRRWEYLGEGNEFATFTATVTHARGNLYQIAEDNGGTVIARVIELREDGAYEILTSGEQYSGDSLLDEEKLAKRDKAADRKLIAWPIKKGAKWSLPNGGRAEIVSTSVTRTVPFGTLKQVVHVHTEGPVESGRQAEPGSDTAGVAQQMASADYYYVDRIGLIERTFRSIDYVVSSKLNKMTLTQ